MQRARALLLEEFRHRTRNDLGSLVGILLLRARAATSEAARDGLREAADHAMALARVHTRLAKDSVAAEDATTVDTREFVVGLCEDLAKAFAGDGLRPVALNAEAEAHRLTTERSVQLGLVLNEAITNAFKYAFPEGRGGQVQVRFVREGGHFLLTVVDDGPGMLPDGDTAETPPAPLPQGSDSAPGCCGRWRPSCGAASPAGPGRLAWARWWSCASPWMRRPGRPAAPARPGGGADGANSGG